MSLVPPSKFDQGRFALAYLTIVMTVAGACGVTWLVAKLFGMLP